MNPDAAPNNVAISEQHPQPIEIADQIADAWFNLSNPDGSRIITLDDARQSQALRQEFIIQPGFYAVVMQTNNGDILYVSDPDLANPNRLIQVPVVFPKGYAIDESVSGIYGGQSVYVLGDSRVPDEEGDIVPDMPYVVILNPEAKSGTVFYIGHLTKEDLTSIHGEGTVGQRAAETYAVQEVLGIQTGQDGETIVTVDLFNGPTADTYDITLKPNGLNSLG